MLMFPAFVPCVILAVMTTENKTHGWIAEIKARRMEGAFALFLDIISPFGPLAAQILWAIQPLSGFLGANDAIRDIATALEEPQGIEALRARLDE